MLKRIICAITSESLHPIIAKHLEFAELAIQGGATMLQLRDKAMSDRDLLATAVALQSLCQVYGVPLVINNRFDIALAANASGVHLGQDDIPIPLARKFLGKNMMIGGSASTLEEALKLEKEGANYVGFGHIFPTKTKLKRYEPRGLVMLKEVSSVLSIPVIAIGGISVENVHSVIQTGAAGFAVISAIAKETKQATQNISKAAWD